MGRFAALVLLGLVATGCSVPVADVTPGPPELGDAMVVEVTANGTGGRVELVKTNVHARARGAALDRYAVAIKRWEQDRLDTGLFTEYADLEPGQTASNLVYHDWMPGEPMVLDIRFDGVSYWKGRVGTKDGGPNHVKLVFENGELTRRVVETVDGLMTDGSWIGGATWTPPDDHVPFELGKTRPDLNPRPVPR